MIDEAFNNVILVNPIFSLSILSSKECNDDSYKKTLKSIKGFPQSTNKEIIVMPIYIKKNKKENSWICLFVYKHKNESHVKIIKTEEDSEKNLKTYLFQNKYIKIGKENLSFEYIDDMNEYDTLNALLFVISNYVQNGVGNKKNMNLTKINLKTISKEYIKRCIDSDEIKNIKTM